MLKLHFQTVLLGLVYLRVACGCGCAGIPKPANLDRFSSEYCAKDLQKFSPKNKCPKSFPELLNASFMCAYENGEWGMTEPKRCTKDETCVASNITHRAWCNNPKPNYSSSLCQCPVKAVADLNPLEAIQFCGSELNKMNKNFGCPANRIITCYQLIDGSVKTVWGTKCPSTCRPSDTDSVGRTCH